MQLIPGACWQCTWLQWDRLTNSKLDFNRRKLFHSCLQSIYINTETMTAKQRIQKIICGRSSASQYSSQCIDMRHGGSSKTTKEYGWDFALHLQEALSQLFSPFSGLPIRGLNSGDFPVTPNIHFLSPTPFFMPGIVRFLYCAACCPPHSAYAGRILS